MDEIKMEREIKEMLHQCGDGLHAPDSMQARVKFALNNAPVRKRHLWSKRFVAVAAVAAIAVTGAFAAGGMGGIFSKGWSDQRLDLSSTQTHLADAGVVLTLPDKIGEYTFSYGSDVDTTARNSVGETEKIAEVDATYTKNGAELNLSAHKSYTVFTEDEMENPVPATTAEVNGVTLTYRDAHYRFVPDDYEKSDEEKQQTKELITRINYHDKVGDDDCSVECLSVNDVAGVDLLLWGHDTQLIKEGTINGLYAAWVENTTDPPAPDGNGRISVKQQYLFLYDPDKLCVVVLWGKWETCEALAAELTIVQTDIPTPERDRDFIWVGALG